jgi:hypothetical protein
MQREDEKKPQNMTALRKASVHTATALILHRDLFGSGKDYTCLDESVMPVNYHLGDYRELELEFDR